MFHSATGGGKVAFTRVFKESKKTAVGYTLSPCSCRLRDCPGWSRKQLLQFRQIPTLLYRTTFRRFQKKTILLYHALPKSKVCPLLSVVDWYAGVLDAEVQYALCWAESYWSVQSIASINACCVFRDVHWISAEIADTCTMCWTLGSSHSHCLISRESRSGTPHDAF